MVILNNQSNFLGWTGDFGPIQDMLTALAFNKKGQVRMRDFKQLMEGEDLDD